MAFCLACQEIIKTFEQAIKHPSNKTKDLDFIVHSIIKSHKCCTQKTIDEFRNKFLPLAQAALDRQSESFARLDTSNYGENARTHIASFLKCLSEATDHYNFVRLQKAYYAGGYGGYHDYKKTLDVNATKFGYELRKTRTDREKQIAKVHDELNELTKEFVTKIDMPYPHKLFFTSFADSLVSIKTLMKCLCDERSLNLARIKDLSQLYDQALHDHGVLVLSQEKMANERDDALAQVSKSNMEIEQLKASLASCTAKLNEIANLLNLCKPGESQEIQTQTSSEIQTETAPEIQTQVTMDIESVKKEYSVAVGTHCNSFVGPKWNPNPNFILPDPKVIITDSSVTAWGTLTINPNMVGGAEMKELSNELDKL